MTRLAAAVAALVSAWTPVTASESAFDVVHLRSHTGARLLVWGSGSSVALSRDGSAPRTILAFAAGAAAAPGALVETPSGEILLYVSVEGTTFRVSSADDGRSWTNPHTTHFPLGSHIESVAMRGDGTPIFAATTSNPDKVESWFLDVFQGRDADHRALAVREGHGTVGARGKHAYVAYARDEGSTFLRRLDRTGSPTGRASRLTRSVVRVHFVPGRGAGVFAVYSTGAPLRMLNLSNGRTTTHALRAHYGGGIEEAVLDRRGRLWVTWLDSGRVNALRAPFVGAPFTRGGHLDVPLHRGAGTGYAVVWSLAAFPLRDGSLELYADVEDQLIRGRLRLRSPA